VEEFLLKILEIDSTTGKEEVLAKYLLANAKIGKAKVLSQPVTDRQRNLFFYWGKPKVIFCTHLDTVAPHFLPYRQGRFIYGRGACDAKGQITALYQVCRELVDEGQSNFGLLLLVREETDSLGAKKANQLITGGDYLIVSEPTDNNLISAAKGALVVKVKATGKAAHSGYPLAGISAVNNLVNFLAKLTKLKYAYDNLLGETTYNIGKLKADNPSNVLAKSAECELMFRTTHASYHKIKAQLLRLAGSEIELELNQGGSPIDFYTIPGLATKTVAFGSDAPWLNNLGKPLLYGAGSILDAHTDRERLAVSALNKAVKDLKRIYYKLLKTTS
jgi:Acetylornithine deacetylase/Succinyl-diaminopimelate desuccinylase and related deacylases